MNNKGQTLVLFLFIIPVILLIFMAFYQFGVMQLEKRQMLDALTSTIEYGLDYQENPKIEEERLRDVFEL